MVSCLRSTLFPSPCSFVPPFSTYLGILFSLSVQLWLVLGYFLVSFSCRLDITSLLSPRFFSFLLQFLQIMWSNKRRKGALVVLILNLLKKFLVTKWSYLKYHIKFGFLYFITLALAGFYTPIFLLRPRDVRNLK